jgi:hypothetical protein
MLLSRQAGRMPRSDRPTPRWIAMRGGDPHGLDKVDDPRGRSAFALPRSLGIATVFLLFLTYLFRALLTLAVVMLIVSWQDAEARRRSCALAVDFGPFGRGPASDASRRSLGLSPENAAVADGPMDQNLCRATIRARGRVAAPRTFPKYRDVAPVLFSRASSCPGSPLFDGS